MAGNSRHIKGCFPFWIAESATIQESIDPFNIHDTGWIYTIKFSTASQRARLTANIIQLEGNISNLILHKVILLTQAYLMASNIWELKRPEFESLTNKFWAIFLFCEIKTSAIYHINSLKALFPRWFPSWFPTVFHAFQSKLWNYWYFWTWIANMW